MATASNSEIVSVGGHRLTLTNLDKVLYPSTGTTKRDVLAYYAEIADVLVPHAANRPATRKRWVNGVGTAENPGEMFFQKNLDDSTPAWVKRRSIEHKEHDSEYPLVNDTATLIWLAQIAALEIHVPQWQFGRTGTRRNPDRLVLDLDPGDGAGLSECAEVARLVRVILEDMGLTAMPVTSGSKGIHLYAALDGKLTSEQVSALARELARALEADSPELVVSDMKKSLRGGKVLLDWSQNNGSKTTITPYSLRGRLEPTVAAPRTWRELTSKDLAQLDYREVLKRVKRRGDPLADLATGHLHSLEPTPDRLTKYRSMRDASKTPEPVPAGHDATSDGCSFVIQEHHARRLHYDFRLEHDGVLVSWALPKGVPTEPKKNHLAVQTEDHPLDYGGFEGTIPAGEYGAGTVTIWDAGTYDLEKWREDEEVIVTLHGRIGSGLGGSRRVALIHTGGNGRSDDNWLIHLMKDAAPTVTARNLPPKKQSPSATSARFVSPMLATSGVPADFAGEDPQDWAFEMKWDGIRAIASVDHGTVTVTSRNGKDLTASYPELAALADAVAVPNARLDGEIVALDSRGRPDFGMLQTRLNLTRAAEVQAAAASVPVKYFVFDVLDVDGRSQLNDDYDSRRRTLADIIRAEQHSAVVVPPVADSGLEAAIATSLELGLEGVMAKRRDSRYLPESRSRSWIKLKNHRSQEVVVVGWTDGTGRRENGVGALLLGIPDGDALRYVGRVGTGFTDRQLEELLHTLTHLAPSRRPPEGITAAESRNVHWVSPTRVGEVEFAGWTSTGRLRQASWRGWRSDKVASDVVREQ